MAALLLALLFRIFSQGLGDAGRAELEGEALLVAQSTLDAFGWTGALPEATAIDRREGRFRVRTSVTPYSGPIDADLQKLYVAPYEIVVLVTWPEGPRERSVSLRTIRLATRASK